MSCRGLLRQELPQSSRKRCAGCFRNVNWRRGGIILLEPRPLAQKRILDAGIDIIL